MYRKLQSKLVLETIVTLEKRILERFPGSSLGGVCQELHKLAEEVDSLVERLSRPAWALRVGAALGVIGLIAMAVWIGNVALHTSLNFGGFGDVLQATEAGVNVIILLVMAIFFMSSLETRKKRAMTLEALHCLRSIVHIIDMHQLTKDPEYVLFPTPETDSSPKRTLTRFLLVRYLDYCSEMLSLTSKVAALHVQYLNDSVVQDAVSDIETLADSLSSKIWQKIMILDASLAHASTSEPVAEI